MLVRIRALNCEKRCSASPANTMRFFCGSTSWWCIWNEQASALTFGKSFGITNQTQKSSKWVNGTQFEDRGDVIGSKCPSNDRCLALKNSKSQNFPMNYHLMKNRNGWNCNRLSVFITWDTVSNKLIVLFCDLGFHGGFVWLSCKDSLNWFFWVGTIQVDSFFFLRYGRQARKIIDKF